MAARMSPLEPARILDKAILRPKTPPSSFVGTLLPLTARIHPDNGRFEAGACQAAAGRYALRSERVVLSSAVIAGFRDADTERLWTTGKSKRLPPQLNRQALKKLYILNAALALENLTVPPGNRLEKLRRDREGQHSIRVNHQYRICFAWRDGNAHDVELVDYH